MVKLVVNSSLTWQDPVYHVITQASKRLLMLFRASSFGSNEDQPIQLYQPEHPTSTEIRVSGMAQRAGLETYRKGCVASSSPTTIADTFMLERFALPRLDGRREQLILCSGKKFVKSSPSNMLQKGPGTRHQDRHRDRCRIERFRSYTIPHAKG